MPPARPLCPEPVTWHNWFLPTDRPLVPQKAELQPPFPPNAALPKKRGGRSWAQHSIQQHQQQRGTERKRAHTANGTHPHIHAARKPLSEHVPRTRTCSRPSRQAAKQQPPLLLLRVAPRRTPPRLCVPRVSFCEGGREQQPGPVLHACLVAAVGLSLLGLLGSPFWGRQAAARRAPPGGGEALGRGALGRRAERQVMQRVGGAGAGGGRPWAVPAVCGRLAPALFASSPGRRGLVCLADLRNSLTHTLPAGTCHLPLLLPGTRPPCIVAEPCPVARCAPGLWTRQVLGESPPPHASGPPASVAGNLSAPHTQRSGR